MKGLAEFAKDKSIVTGKKVYEGLKLGKKRYLVFNMPVIEDCELQHGKIAGKLTLTHPEHKYYVYKDMYHGARPHLAPLDDMLFNVGSWLDEYADYEDSFEDKYILFSAKTEKEILKWYVEEYIGVKFPTKKIEQSEFVEQCENALKRNGYTNSQYPNDSLEVLYDFCVGFDSLKNCEMTTIDIYNQDAVIEFLSDYF